MTVPLQGAVLRYSPLIVLFGPCHTQQNGRISVTTSGGAINSCSTWHWLGCSAVSSSTQSIMCSSMDKMCSFSMSMDVYLLYGMSMQHGCCTLMALGDTNTWSGVIYSLAYPILS